MSVHRWRNLAAAGAATLLAVSAAQATAPYLGNWKIVSVKLAPWADKARGPDTSDRKELLGKTVTLTTRGIVGPPILVCKGPHYKLTDLPADRLFQGAFGEMRQKDEAVDPAKVAVSLGFQGESWQVLETGCTNQIDWHFVNDTTVVIGFNDNVYLLKKQ